MKENYQNPKALLDAINYAQYEWDVIGDFKMVAFLMSLQGGFTKFPCFLCLWDSRNTSLHYKVKELAFKIKLRRWHPQREASTIGGCEESAVFVFSH